MRAVLDPNVFISALLSSRGAPARVLRMWVDGSFDLVVSARLLDELERALGHPKVAKHITPDDAAEFVVWLRENAIVALDPSVPPLVRSPDPGDDYLIALAASERAALVTGDSHLLGLPRLPVYRPAAFLDVLDATT